MKTFWFVSCSCLFLFIHFQMGFFMFFPDCVSSILQMFFWKLVSSDKKLLFPVKSMRTMMKISFSVRVVIELWSLWWGKNLMSFPLSLSIFTHLTLSENSTKLDFDLQYGMCESMWKLSGRLSIHFLLTKESFNIKFDLGYQVESTTKRRGIRAEEENFSLLSNHKKLRQNSMKNVNFVSLMVRSLPSVFNWLTYVRRAWINTEKLVKFLWLMDREHEEKLPESSLNWKNSNLLRRERK